MQLNKREKTLAAVAGAIGLLLAAGFLLGGGGPSLGSLRADRDRLAAEIQEKEARIAAARRATVELAEWQRRSLPADPANARSLYQNWLRELADRAEVHRLNVDSSEGQSQRNVYTLFSFTVRGRAGLGALTQFLYEFYSAGHLHQIRRMDVEPIEGSSDLDVTISVEALSLTGADRKDRLGQEPGKRLKLPKLADYRDVIVGRNLFAPPAPPSAPARESLARLDPAEHTFVTAILEVDGRAQVWLVDRTAGKLLKLNEGDSFETGPVRGSVKTIRWGDVVVEIDGRGRRLRVGENLRSGIDVGPQRAETEVVHDKPVGGTNAPNP